MSSKAQAGPARPRARKGRRFLRLGLAVLGVALAGALLYRTLSQTSMAELRVALASVAPGRVAAALAFAAASYMCLTLFDWLGARYAGRPLPWRKAARASFVSLSLGHNIGFAALSSGAIRYRFYARWGFRAEDVAKLIAFCALTVGLGLAGLAGLALTFAPQAVAGLGLSAGAARALGLGCLFACAIWLACCVVLRGRMRVRGWTLALPEPRLALAQLMVGPLNFACVAACLHQALSAFAPVDYGPVATAYVAANVATLISHAPGGLGVIETVVGALIPGERVLAALILFRFAYFIIPLALGLILFAYSEARIRRARG
jgi:uncharacterized membrane protein YbhN (UPF0104 family)